MKFDDQHHNNHYNVWWDTLHIYDSWHCRYLIINFIDQLNKHSILESENPLLCILLHLLLYHPLPLDANIILRRGEEFAKDITECNLFHTGKLFQQTTANLQPSISRPVRLI